MRRSHYRHAPLESHQEPEGPYTITGFDPQSGTAEKRDKETGALIGFVTVGFDWSPPRGK